MSDAKLMQDVVLSSRVRIARNLPDVPFPRAMNDAQAQEIIYNVLNALKQQDQAFTYHPMVNEPALTRQSMVEKHWISPDLAENPQKSALLISADETLSVMLHEEDHLRVQCILPGYQGKAALTRAMDLVRVLERQMQFAYQEPLGYLTCCPTNVGTGLRVSFMVHLPALALSGELQKTLDDIRPQGMTIRGIYGEGSSAQGHIYQISNQVTLGVTEEECLQIVETTIQEIIDREMNARKHLDEEGGYAFQDRLMRAVGLLRYARKISSKEATSLLSLAWLASDLGYWQGMEDAELHALLIAIQPATLSCLKQSQPNEAERDVFRAKYLREKLEPYA